MPEITLKIINKNNYSFNVHYVPLPAAVNAEGKHSYNDCLLWLVWMTSLFYASSCRDGCFPAFISSTQCIVGPAWEPVLGNLV